MHWEIIASVVGATIAVLTFVFVVVKALLGVRKGDMDELRALSSKDMEKVLEVREEDMTEIRETHKKVREDLVIANDKNSEAHEKLHGSVALVLEGINKVGTRVGMIEAWREGHQREDDRAHQDIEVLKGEHRIVLQDVASLKAKSRRTKSKKLAKRHR